MALLVLGLLIFAAIHLIPAGLPEFRATLISKISLLGYKALYALLSLGGFKLIIEGWKAATPEYFYMLPGMVRMLTFLLMLVAVVLFVTSFYQTRIKQWIRHPQLTAVILFAIAHLLANGDSRSMVLFGGLGIWAIVEMCLINKRDGEWVKGKPVGWSVEIVGIVFSLMVVAGLVHSHVYLSGIPLM